MYRGADTSLARPGRKQSRKHVREARDLNSIETHNQNVYYLFLVIGESDYEIAPHFYVIRNMVVRKVKNVLPYKDIY